MNEDTDGSGVRRAGLRRAAAAALAGTALLAAACGGSHSAGPSASTGQLTAQKVDAFAQCMRSRGVPDFYPSRAGNTSFNGPVVELGPWIFTDVNPGSPQFAAAFKACRRLTGLPAGPPPALTSAQVHQLVQAAACMRAHGYPGYPDPDLQNGHLVETPLPASIDTSSPQFQAAVNAC